MRGLIFFVKLPTFDDVDACSVEQGRRPVVVVSSHRGNATSNIVMVCPITTKCKNLSCNVDIRWSVDGRQSQVLCNQIMTIPRAYLKWKRGSITMEEQKRVDDAICMSLDISEVNTK